MKYALYILALGWMVSTATVWPVAQPLLTVAVLLAHIPALLKITAQRKLFGKVSALYGRDDLLALTMLAGGWGIVIWTIGNDKTLVPVGLLTLVTLITCYEVVKWSSKFTIAPSPISSFEAPQAHDPLARRGQSIAYALRCVTVIGSAATLTAPLLGANEVFAVALVVDCVVVLAVLTVWVLVLVRMRARLGPLLKAAQLSEVRTAVSRLKPGIVLYYSSPQMKNTKAILSTIKQLDATRQTFFVLVREHRVLEALQKAGVANLVLAERIEQLDHFITDSLKLAIYINDSEKNGHFIRFNKLHHINVLPASAATWDTLPPNFDMYDTLLTRSPQIQEMLAAAATPETSEKLVCLQDAKMKVSIPIFPASTLPAIDGTVTIGWALDAPCFDGCRDWLLIQRAAEHVFTAISDSSTPPLRLLVTFAKKQDGDRNYNLVLDELQAYAEALSDSLCPLDTANHVPRIQFQTASVQNGYNRSDIALCGDFVHLDQLRASGKPIIFFDALDQTDDIPGDLYVLKHDLSNLKQVLSDAAGSDTKADQRRMALARTAEATVARHKVASLGELLASRLERAETSTLKALDSGEVAA